MEALSLVFSFLLGSLIGSFTNVLIHRIPRGENIAFPPSKCPKCGHRLGVLDLFPVFSWVFLGGKCRYCKEPISWRYPVVELISGLGYLAIAWKFPFLDAPLVTLALWFLFTMLLAGSAIDLETKILPDEFTLPAVGVGLVVAFFAGSSNFPNFQQALEGALIGAGVLALIAGYGAWILRKFAEVKYPTPPLDYQTVHLGGLVGAWAGVLGGFWWAIGASLAAMALHAAINLISRRYMRVPDALTLGGLVVSLILPAAIPGVGFLALVTGALLGAGAVAIVAGIAWVFLPDPWKDIPEEDLDPVAMGFGDVKLLAAIGAFLGWQGVVFGLGAAIALGAVIGVIGRLLGGGREIPFGPYIAVGALLALFTGSAPLLAYLRQFGL